MNSMKTHWKLTIRRMVKWLFGKLILAPLYRICCLQPVQRNLVVLADGHQNAMPYSMTAVADRLRQIPGLQVVEYFRDYSFSGAVNGLLTMIRFMPLYARAGYVFISDCYVPVSCCRKRGETTVVQLWHSCGLMKKVGRDSAEERKLMAGNQFRNFDVFTTSAGCVSDVLSHAMNIPRGVFCDAGVTRMDLYFDETRTQGIRERFFEKYPEYRGKKILLWAPTFRGTAQSSHMAGQDDILRLKAELPPEYALIIKTHRFANCKEIDSGVDISAENLLAVADMLITDYSSIYYDYLHFRRPIVRFAPDLAEYRRNTGMYVDYEALPGPIAGDYDALLRAVLTADEWCGGEYLRGIDEVWQQQMEYCDGHSTEKLLRRIGLL